MRAPESQSINDDRAEALRRLNEWNPPPPRLGDPIFFHREFERWVQKRPRATAVISPDKTLSYRDLDRRANRLARYLRQYGAGPEIPIALCLERSCDFIVGLLAIAKSGGACAFLDPSYPPHRITDMIRESGASLLVTAQATAQALPLHDARVIAVDRDGPAIAEQSDQPISDRLSPGNLSSIFFTSGSTGAPKAVMWQYGHRLLPESRRWKGHPIPRAVRPKDRHLFKASVGFTLVTREAMLPLRTGGTIIIVPPGQEKDAGFLVEQIIGNRISSLTLVPTLLNLILDEPDLARCRSLREVVSFGEKLSPHLFQDVFKKTRAVLSVVYGATEAPSATTWIASAGEIPPPSSVGFINPGRRVYILDNNLHPVLPGVTGEIYVGGNLSRGYAGRPAFTAERFLPDPYSPIAGARMYRTGDLGRFTFDGMIELVGRADGQVKIRGYRVELGEIEAALAEHQAVRSAVVIVHQTDTETPVLAAYYETRGSGAPPNETELFHHLRARLPSFMIPNRIVRLEELPLNRNGKVDRAAISLPAPDDRPGDSPALPPRTATESALCHIWEEILGRSHLGIDDNFFDLGGHSIHAARITAQARREFDIDLSVTGLFNHPTIADFAAEIDRATGSAATGLPPFPALTPTCSLDPATPAPTTSSQRAMVKENERTIASGLPSNTGIYHYLFQGNLNESALEEALREMVRRHHILRTTYRKYEGGIQQIVQPVDRFRLDIIDEGSGMASGERELPREVHQRMATDYFDLFTELPIRSVLLRCEEGNRHFILALHHVTFDHVTSRLFFRELWSLYLAFLRGQPSPLPEPFIQYADYAAWEARWLRRGTERYDRLSDYWLRQLKGAPPSPETLLAATVPVESPPLEDCLHPIILPPETILRLRKFARLEKATPFMVLLAGVTAVFHLGGEFDDVILSTFVDNRTRPELAEIFGCFTRGIPLRTRISPGMSFSDLLQRVRSTCLDAFAHQDFPSDKIGDTLRRAEEPPLRIRAAIQILEEKKDREIPPPELEVDRVNFGPPFRIGSTDFFIQFIDSGETLSGTLYSGSGRSCPDLLRAFTGALSAILGEAVKDPDRELSSFAPLTARVIRKRFRKN